MILCAGYFKRKLYCYIVYLLLNSNGEILFLDNFSYLDIGFRENFTKAFLIGIILINDLHLGIL